jgi:hypothetical protein
MQFKNYMIILMDVDYNYRSLDITPGLEARSEGPAEFAAMTGTDVPT